MVDAVDLHLEMKVVADLAPDRPHDFLDETRAVLQRAAIFVLPVVDAGTQKLGDQIAVGAVKLDPVETRLPGARAPSANCSPPP